VISSAILLAAWTIGISTPSANAPPMMPPLHEPSRLIVRSVYSISRGVFCGQTYVRAVQAALQALQKEDLRTRICPCKQETKTAFFDGNKKLRRDWNAIEVVLQEPAQFATVPFGPDGMSTKTSAVLAIGGPPGATFHPGSIIALGNRMAPGQMYKGTDVVFSPTTYPGDPFNLAKGPCGSDSLDR
jgi:hypothetical protein